MTEAFGSQVRLSCSLWTIVFSNVPICHALSTAPEGSLSHVHLVFIAIVMFFLKKKSVNEPCELFYAPAVPERVQ